jgi:hypothetical protein
VHLYPEFEARNNFLVPFEAPYGASTFGDGDLNTDTKMSVQRPCNMFLLFLWIKGSRSFKATALLTPIGSALLAFTNGIATDGLLLNHDQLAKRTCSLLKHCYVLPLNGTTAGGLLFLALLELCSY